MRNRIIATLLALTVTFCGSRYMSGCGTTAEQRKKFLTEAGNILSKVAISAIVSAVQSQVQEGNGDMMHAAASGAWRAVSVDDLRGLINSATGNTQPELAAIASTLAMQAVDGKMTSNAQAINAVASVISATALSK